MPHINFWIRAEDWEFWERIKDKPQFMHDAIQATSLHKEGKLPFTTLQPKKEVDSALPKNLKKLFEEVPVSVGITDRCPHNMIWGACGYASCKKVKS